MMRAEIESSPQTESGIPPGIAPSLLAHPSTSGAEKVTRLLESLTQAGSALAAPTLGNLHVPSLHPSTARDQVHNSLMVARLGIAASLHYALMSKHPPTAAHCVRVALSCSAWCETMGMDEPTRQRIELAAVMHDLGKIGIPDRILRKPAKLSEEEQSMMSLAPLLGCDILRRCSGDEELIELVQFSTAWYAGRPDQILTGTDLPLGARIIAIADAFDSMISDQVYRRAMSRESAIGNLFGGSGVQFDPDLTRHFAAVLEQSPTWPPESAKLTWLRLGPIPTDGLPWEPPHPVRSERQTGPERALGHEAADKQGSTTMRGPLLESLLNTMTEAVIFVDSLQVIKDWNEAASRLTGIAADAVLHSEWKPTLLNLARENGGVVAGPNDCPVETALTTSVGVTGRFRIIRGDGNILPVDLRAIPIAAQTPRLSGVMLMLRDLSDESRLENSVRKLQRQVIMDPLTGVANRAEMDRCLGELTGSDGRTFSLIICDIDHFKKVNDVHGHQAGDEALVRVAQILGAQSREGDLVCRYGGEEFVVICPDCDLVSANRRAEAIRIAIEQSKLSMLENNNVTASFGVTQVQPGDTAESVFARADRALLQAKSSGRNRVIQLGVGGQFQAVTTPTEKRTWRTWFTTAKECAEALEATIITAVPTDIVIEKLRGFMSDYQAEFVKTSGDHIELKLSVAYATAGRRLRPSRLTFHVQLQLVESTHQIGVGNRVTTQNRTAVRVSMSAEAGNGRREEDVTACARKVLIGLNSYLIGQIEA
jgi:diguanylate cyclase (GGDEF)-like protein/PAS domain S-box-containing protein